jgi:hypothetical protein
MIEWFKAIADRIANHLGYEKRFDSVSSLLEHDAIRQQYESLFGGPPSPPFAALGNPFSSSTDQSMAAYRHLSEPGFVSRDKSGSEWPLLKKFDD